MDSNPQRCHQTPKCVSTHAPDPNLPLLFSISLLSPLSVKQNFDGLQTTYPPAFVIISSMSRKQQESSPNKVGNFRFLVYITSPLMGHFIPILETVLGIQARLEKGGGEEGTTYSIIARNPQYFWYPQGSSDSEKPSSPRL